MADIDNRMNRFEARLRQVVTLLAEADVAYTTIPDPNGQGDFEGHDRFISPTLRDEARDLLTEWDQEDDAPATPGASS